MFLSFTDQGETCLREIYPSFDIALQLTCLSLVPIVQLKSSSEPLQFANKHKMKQHAWQAITEIEIFVLEPSIFCLILLFERVSYKNRL